MKILKKYLLLLVAVMIFALTACSKPATGDTPQNNQKEQFNENDNQKQEQEPEEVKPVTVKHELGEVTFDAIPEKVVVFDYGTLDALNALGIEIVGLPKSNIPEFLSKFNGDAYADMGTLFEPNYEAMFELKPDLIFISGRQKDMYEEFNKIAPTIYLPMPGNDYINTFKGNMSIIAETFRIEDKVNEKITEIENAIKDLYEKVTASGKNALFIMANEGSMSVYGEDSRFGMLYKDFGFIPADDNIEEATAHGNKVSFEYLAEKNPDYLFVLDRGAVTKASEDLSAEKLLDNDLVKSINAYKDGNIVYVDAHVWYVAAGGISGTLTMVNEVAESLK